MDKIESIVKEMEICWDSASAETVAHLLKSGFEAVELLRFLYECGDIRGISGPHDERIATKIETALDNWDQLLR